MGVLEILIVLGLLGLIFVVLARGAAKRRKAAQGCFALAAVRASFQYQRPSWPAAVRAWG